MGHAASDLRGDIATSGPLHGGREKERDAMARQTSCKVELGWIEPGNRPGRKRPPLGALLFSRNDMANGWMWLRLMLWQSPIHNIFIFKLKNPIN
ncbi:hypothetical protein ACU4GD_34475 [Cupriavidus basilensis]